MVELNLLPDVKKQFIRAQRTRNQVISIAIIAILSSIGLLVFFAMFVYGAQTLHMSQLTKSIQSKESELEGVQDINKYLTVQSQLEQIDPLHQDKHIYSRLMDYMVTLNPVAPHNIQLESMKVDSAEETIVFTGSTKSFESFNVFKDTLINARLVYEGSDPDSPENLFNEVVVESSTLGRMQNETVVSFVVRTVYNSSAFANDVSGVNVTVPNRDTTQSRRNAPIFNSQVPEGGTE